MNHVSGLVNWLASFGSVWLMALVTSLTPDLARTSVWPDRRPPETAQRNAASRLMAVSGRLALHRST